MLQDRVPGGVRLQLRCSVSTINTDIVRPQPLQSALLRSGPFIVMNEAELSPVFLLISELSK
jgi:hypothetical protein